ncbi:MAG: tetratricopeptide repeat protein, partial [Candidatus Aminicenantaceae bacterium]
VAVLCAVVLVAASAFLYLGREGPVVPSSEVKMLVVLPFENLGSQEDEYFADGLTEELTNRLSYLHGLGVISRTSANQYKETPKTIKQIGEELGVDYVLEGAVRWERKAENSGQVRVTPQLIRVSDDTHLWSERYDRVIEDIFSVQSEIAEEVAQQLDLAVLAPERRALNRRPTDNIEAWDTSLRGLEHLNRGYSQSDPKEIEQGIHLHERAVELDPNFALAYVNMSFGHSWLYFFGFDRTEERLEKSKAAADRALEIQPDMPGARQALANYYYRGFLDYDRAAEIFESIQKERPNFNPDLLGFIQRRQGKWEQALETLKKAFRLNPLNDGLAYEIGGACVSMRKYEEAETWFNRSLSINPNRFQPQLGKIGILVLTKGNTDEVYNLLEAVPGHPLTDYMWFTIGMADRNYQQVLDRLSSLAYESFEEQHFYFEKNLTYASVYHVMREVALMRTHAESARIVLQKKVRERPDDPRYHAALGLSYAYLGDKNKAIQEGIRATQLYPVSKDAAQGPIYIINLARIYTVVGEYNNAVDQLEYMLSNPTAEYLWHLVSVPYLRLDPRWDPLREHPRFKRLLEAN